MKNTTIPKDGKSLQSLFELLFQNSRDIVLLISPENGRILEANSTAINIYGYNRDELLTKSIFDLRCFPETDFVNDQMTDATSEGTLFETLHKRKGGNFFPVEISSHKVEVNNQEALLTVIRDFSERKQLKDSEERYRAIVELSPDMIVIHSEDKFLYLNSAGIKLLGAKNADELIGVSIMSVIHPDYKEAVKLRVQKMIEDNKKMPDEEQKIITINGDVIDVEVQSCPIVYQGRIAVQTVLRDITKRKRMEKELRLHQLRLEEIVKLRTKELRKSNRQLATEIEQHKKTLRDLYLSEERFSKAFMANPAVMSIENLTTGSYIDVNESFLRITGYSRKEVIGSTSEKLNLWANPEDRHVILERLMQNSYVRNYEIVYRTKENKLRSGLLSAEIVFLDGQQCMLTVTNDITKRKQLEREMTRFDQLNLVGEMAAGIGHEIRNPMTSVRGFLQILTQKDRYTQDKAILDLMIEELDRANDIIKEYLSLAKNKVTNKKKNNLNSIIKALYPLINADALVSDKLIVLELGKVPELLLDDGEIRQLILNLVRNGFEAMSDGKTLNIRTYVEGDETVLAIADQGCGIASEVLDRIGTPFFTTKDNGTGLGLAVCYSIAARHKASISVNSSPQGTVFYVRFRQ